MANHRQPVFRGRASERGVLDGLLQNVRGAQSAVLVIRGEPGVGKTTLLRYCVRQASGFRVVESVGIESEIELPFAGLHQLCAPLLASVRRASRFPNAMPCESPSGCPPAIPRSAFWLRCRAQPARAAADERPLLWVIDDAQWFDWPQRRHLDFVARRLLASR